MIFICLYTCNQSTRSEPTTTLKFTKVVLSVLFAVHRGLCRIFTSCNIVPLSPFLAVFTPAFWCRCFLFGQPFVKRFALCYRSVVCLSLCLSVCPVCNVGALWPNGWMDQVKTWHAGRSRPRHFVLDGDPPHSPKWGGAPNKKQNRFMFIMAKRLDGSRQHFAWR